jgi:hypothetical protein
LAARLAVCFAVSLQRTGEAPAWRIDQKTEDRNEPQPACAPVDPHEMAAVNGRTTWA